MNIYHVTGSTHNSRVSERMVTYRVSCGKPVLFDDVLECEVTNYITHVVKENNLKVLAYNICLDHVHMILACESGELSSNVAKLKGKSAFLFKKAREIKDVVHLWGQKFHAEEIRSETQLEKTMNYATYNRQKHELPVNNGLQPLVLQMVTSLSKAFSQEEKIKLAGSGA
jgi:REP element-mobilizing transposase RayT